MFTELEEGEKSHSGYSISQKVSHKVWGKVRCMVHFTVVWRSWGVCPKGLSVNSSYPLSEPEQRDDMLGWTGKPNHLLSVGAKWSQLGNTKRWTLPIHSQEEWDQGRPSWGAGETRTKHSTACQLGLPSSPSDVFHTFSVKERGRTRLTPHLSLSQEGNILMVKKRGRNNIKFGCCLNPP